MGQIGHEFEAWRLLRTFSTVAQAAPRRPLVGGDEEQRRRREYRPQDAPMAWERPAEEAKPRAHLGPTWWCGGRKYAWRLERARTFMGSSSGFRRWSRRTLAHLRRHFELPVHLRGDAKVTTMRRCLKLTSEVARRKTHVAHRPREYAGWAWCASGCVGRLGLPAGAAASERLFQALHPQPTAA